VTTSPFSPFTLYGVADTTAYNNPSLDRWSFVPGSTADDTAYPFLMVNTGSAAVTALDITVAPVNGLINISRADNVEHYTTTSLGVSGDTTTFVVGRGNGSFTSDSTGLAAVIDFTPSAAAVPAGNGRARERGARRAGGRAQDAILRLT
jgi:hypothetical protein